MAAATSMLASEPLDHAETVSGIPSSRGPSSSLAIQHAAGHMSMPWKCPWLCRWRLSEDTSVPYSRASLIACRPAITAISGGARRACETVTMPVLSAASAS